MKILVCGSRDWRLHDPVRERLSVHPPGTIIVHGNARGADTVADIVAGQLGFEIRRYPANWEKYGKAAGMRRNAEMLTQEHPDKDDVGLDCVMGFSLGPVSKSRGTHGMIKLAEKAGIDTLVYEYLGLSAV